jgi:pimeloyl-ACP methyl ester carboxylesterase
MQHFVADDGETIHLEIAGTGSPLVMLHGWTASHQEFSPVVAALGVKHRVFRWDARGHGGHRLGTATRPTVARMAQDLANLLAHYALTDAVLVGHSMGALTAWEYLRAFGTGGIRSLCLIDQSPKLVTGDDWKLGIYGDFDRHRAAAFESDLRADFAEAVLRLAAQGNNARARETYARNTRGWQHVREALSRLDPAPLIEVWESLVAADYRDVLPRIDVPTLLVWGGESNFYDLSTARYVHDRIEGSVLHVYDDTDHSPHQWQRERFERDLLAFAGR